MKKFLIICGLLTMAHCSWAQQGHDTTTDHVSLNAVQLDLGGEYKEVIASVDGISAYTAFGLDIYLPAGYEFVQLELENQDEELELTYTARGAALKTTHTLQSALQGDGALRVTALSQSSALFKSTSIELFKFYVKATPYAKPGNADVQIKKCFFNTTDGIQWDTEDLTISDKLSAASSTSISLSISATNHWSTCILPFDAELPTGVTAYSTSAKTTIDDADYLILSKVNALEGYKPYILYSETAYSGSLEGTVDATKYPTEGYVTDGYLNGAITVQQITDGFVLQNLTEGMKFYATGGQTFSIPAGKCWVTLPSAEAKAFGFALEDETGVKPIRDLKQYENEVYDLSGKKIDIRQTRVNHIYIINGQKVLKTK